MKFKFHIILVLAILMGISANALPVQAAFKFVAWGDTKTATSILQSLSTQVISLNPVFTLYAGDAVDSWSQANFDLWINALNGGNNNGLLNRTFPVRGNHEGSASLTSWQTNLNLIQTAANTGATNFSELIQDTVYSFDYQNTHIVGLDALGDASTLTNAELDWLEGVNGQPGDLTKAEARGIKHTFIFFHGPLYCVNGHCTCTSTVCTPTNAVIARVIRIINAHPSVSATFHGHEHVMTWTHINSSRIPEVTHEFEELISGDAGAGVSAANAVRYDYVLPNHGFVLINVTSDTTFTASWFAQGGGTTPATTKTFSKTGTTPVPVTLTPTAPKPSPTPNNTNYQSTIVPAYFYPGSTWNQLITTGNSGDVAIINPSNGPGTAKDSQYQSVVQQSVAKGMIIAGYVYTGYGTRDAAVVKSDIDKFYTWYGINAIFLDETSNSASGLPYYQSLFDYIKQRSGLVIINPGTTTIEGYMNVCDVAMIFENTYANYVGASFPSWVTNYPSNRFVHLVYGTPQASMSQAINLSKQRNAGYVYVTDDVLPNPWDTLPPYWSQEISLIHTGSPPPATPTPYPWLTQFDLDHDNNLDVVDLNLVVKAYSSVFNVFGFNRFLGYYGWQ